MPHVIIGHDRAHLHVDGDYALIAAHDHQIDFVPSFMCTRTNPGPPHRTVWQHRASAPTVGAGQHTRRARQTTPARRREHTAPSGCATAAARGCDDRDRTPKPLTRHTRQTVMPHTERGAGARAPIGRAIQHTDLLFLQRTGAS